MTRSDFVRVSGAESFLPIFTKNCGITVDRGMCRRCLVRFGELWLHTPDVRNTEAWNFWTTFGAGKWHAGSSSSLRYKYMNVSLGHASSLWVHFFRTPSWQSSTLQFAYPSLTYLDKFLSAGSQEIGVFTAGDGPTFVATSSVAGWAPQVVLAGYADRHRNWIGSD